jgi:hypothetical protein
MVRLTWTGKASALLVWLASLPPTLTVCQYVAMQSHGAMQAE